MIFKNNCIQIISYTNACKVLFMENFSFFILSYNYPFHLNASMRSFIFVNLETWALIEIEKKCTLKYPGEGK